MPDARDILLLIPFSVGACRATQDIPHIENREFPRQHFVVESQNCFIKLLSYKWPTETSEQSYKKTIPVNSFTSVVDVTELLGDSIRQLVGNTLATIDSFTRFLLRLSCRRPVTVHHRRETISKPASSSLALEIKRMSLRQVFFSGARSRRQQQACPVNRSRNRPNRSLTVFGIQPDWSEHTCNVLRHRQSPFDSIRY